MPKLKLDLRQVKAGSEPIPEGHYDVEVIDADIREGKDSGQPYLWLHAKVLEGEHQNRRLFFQSTLNHESQGLGITFASVNALLGEDVCGQEFELDTDDFIGCEAVAVVSIEQTPEGEDRNRCKYLRPIDPDSDLATARAEKKELW